MIRFEISAAHQARCEQLMREIMEAASPEVAQAKAAELSALVQPFLDGPTRRPQGMFDLGLTSTPAR
jgi:hypothetical protein